MNQIAVVYWSGTGNTAMMAEQIAQGATAAGAAATVFTADSFDESQMDQFDVIAFGCPSMGVEQLEESEFEPMFIGCEEKLAGKKIALFGSYGWGDGEWMRTWEEQCRSDRAVLVCDAVICNEQPDEQANSDCQQLGKTLAGA